jgi:hypothetical protein
MEDTHCCLIVECSAFTISSLRELKEAEHMPCVTEQSCLGYNSMSDLVKLRVILCFKLLHPEH